MSSYIEQGKKCIIDIVEKIKSSEKADVQFSYIAYRDHHANEEFCTKVYDFTASLQKMRTYIGNHGAAGGGDGPEAVAAALHEALNLPYRKQAVKIVVIILDAPPHGVTKSGDDNYPNGDPNGRDPIVIARSMAEKGIVLYVVACEPSLSGYKYAHDFMAGLAKITEGRYLPLTSAHLLPQVIIGGAKEEISLQKLEEDALKEMEKLKKENPNAKEEDLEEKLATSWAKEGKKVKIGALDDIYGSYNESNIKSVAEEMTDLKSFQKNVKELKQPEMKMKSAAPSADKKKFSLFAKKSADSSAAKAESNDENDDGGGDMQSYAVSEKSIEKEHISKVLNRAKKNQLNKKKIVKKLLKIVENLFVCFL